MHLIAAAGHLIATSKTKSSSGSSYTFLVLIALFAVMYFAFIRPRNRKQRENMAQKRKVQVGDRAQTIGGMIGTITRQTDDVVTVRSDSGVELDFTPQAIHHRIDPVVPESTDDEAAPDAHDDGPDAPGSDH